jgi:hypothetical protein
VTSAMVVFTLPRGARSGARTLTGLASFSRIASSGSAALIAHMSADSDDPSSGPFPCGHGLGVDRYQSGGGATPS